MARGLAQAACRRLQPRSARAGAARAASPSTARGSARRACPDEGWPAARAANRQAELAVAAGARRSRARPRRRQRLRAPGALIGWGESAAGAASGAATGPPPRRAQGGDPPAGPASTRGGTGDHGERIAVGHEHQVLVHGVGAPARAQPRQHRRAARASPSTSWLAVAVSMRVLYSRTRARRPPACSVAANAAS